MTPIDQLNQRLANGEISTEQHQKIFSLLKSTEVLQLAPPNADSLNEHGHSISGTQKNPNLAVTTAIDVLVSVLLLVTLYCAVFVTPKYFPGINLNQPVTLGTNVLIMTGVVIVLSTRLWKAFSRLRSIHQTEKWGFIATFYLGITLMLGLVVLLSIVVAFFVWALFSISNNPQ